MKNYKKLALLLLLSSFPAFAHGNKPLDGLNIMLDPGHGGADSGAVGRLGLKESDTNLRVARYLRMLLEHDGANVSLTREKQEDFKSLAQRVEMSNKSNPDLFISIHHNASLNPNPTNHSEIYYNGLDNGISKYVGNALNNGLAEAQYAGESKLIPGGFYVLRNNNVPSILTEGSYISIPESETQLRSGKGLTNEAIILWKSIRKAYSKGTLNVDFYCNTDENIILDSPYFNILFTGNKPIQSIETILNNKICKDINVKNIMAYPLTYNLYNTKPLNSGSYELSLIAKSYEGLPTNKKTLKLIVALPINKITLSSVAPHIPLGYKGKFPIDIKVFDERNNLNTRSAIAKIDYSGKSDEFLTNASGFTTAFINLDGSERGEIEVAVSVENSEPTKIVIPIIKSSRHSVLGQLVGVDNLPISNAKISHGGKLITNTNKNGYFFFEYDLSVEKLDIDVEAQTAYKPLIHTLYNTDDAIVKTQLNAEAISPALLNKKIGIMAPDSLNNMVVNLAKPLINAGAKVIRLNMPSKLIYPEHHAVLEANLIKDLSMVISLKTENISTIQIRHYHSSKNGKKLANAVKDTFKSNYPKVSIKSCAGSDYELGHTGAMAVVIAIPAKPDEKTREALVNHLSQALKSNK